jgi:hypothetical protein
MITFIKKLIYRFKKESVTVEDLEEKKRELENVLEKLHRIENEIKELN